MSQDNQTPNSNEEKASAFVRQFNVDLTTFSTDVDYAKAILAKYHPAGSADTTWQELSKVPDLVVDEKEGETSAEVDALMAEVTPLEATATEDIKALVADAFHGIIAGVFAEAATEETAQAGVSPEDAKQMTEQAEKVMHSLENNDTNVLEGELTMLAAARMAIPLSKRIAKSRSGGKDAAARKQRCKEDLVIVENNIDELWAIGSKYQTPGIDNNFNKLEDLARKAVLNGKDADVVAFMTALLPLGATAKEDFFKVLDLALEGFTAFEFATAEAKALDPSDPEAQQLQQAPLMIIMNAAGNANNQTGGEFVTLLAAMEQEPLAARLAQQDS